MEQKSTWPTVAFKLARGGEFFNPGHLSYDGQKTIDYYTDSLSPAGEDSDSPYWIKPSGGPVGLTLAESETGIGRIDIDGLYDTVYCKRLDDCTDVEMWLIYQQEPQLIVDYRSSYEDPQVVAVLHEFKVLFFAICDLIAIDEDCLSSYQIIEVTEAEYNELDWRYCTIKTLNGRYYYRPD